MVKVSQTFTAVFFFLCAVCSFGLKLRGKDEDEASMVARIESLEKELAALTEELVEHEQKEKVMDSTRHPEGRNLAERIRYLERKVDGNSNWLRDPQLWRKTQYACKNIWDVGTGNEHHVCLDGWDPEQRQDKGCIVYDLGIRQQPEFGVNLMQKYNCSVRAYDPSPVAQEWWASTESAHLRKQGESRYKFHPFAAGGVDGDLELFESDWQQVSIVKQEWDDHTVNDNLPKEERLRRQRAQKVFKLQAKTLPTMMKENGDDHIDILKIDIEGSEYMFLQDVFDRMGCPPASQITLEYHYFSLDERYGSSPQLNTIHNLLNSCGFKAFRVRDHWKNWITEDKTGKGTAGFHIDPKRFTLISFCRDCGQ